jgi:hypothetical protein
LGGPPVSEKGFHGDDSNGLERESLGRKSLDMKKILWIIVPVCLIGLIGICPITVFALSPEKVIALKKAGVSEETIRLMIQQEEGAQKNTDDVIGRREIKDGQGNTVIIYSTGRSSANEKSDEEKKKVENSWKMLQNMMIDGRSKSNPKTD